MTAVLAWTNPALAPSDYQQIALQLTGHARAVAADVEHHAQQPPNTTAAARSPTSSWTTPTSCCPSRSKGTRPCTELVSRRLTRARC
ncbi:hypothetical protein [Streptomyces sp. cf386]|uniref:hypothetical protein n=1 Tax=Streptomyces sp. cf386 TaxID=1761904 RepID=UPI00115F9DFB